MRRLVFLVSSPENPRPTFPLLRFWRLSRFCGRRAKEMNISVIPDLSSITSLKNHNILSKKAEPITNLSIFNQYLLPG
jgi:hypothetical protein